MGKAIVGTAAVGTFRVGVTSNAFQALKKQMETIGVCDVTRRRLTLGAQDATTGWYKKYYVDTTIEGIFISRGTTHMLHGAGFFVRLDALFMCQDAVEVGDEIITDNNVNYEVKAVRPQAIGNSFSHRECDLTLLPFRRA